MVDRPPDLGGFNLWEWVGGFAGGIVSLAYDKPATKLDFATRLIVSVVMGGTFGFMVGQYQGWPNGARYAFAGGAAVAIFSYALIGVGYRVLKGVTSLPKTK